MIMKHKHFLMAGLLCAALNFYSQTEADVVLGPNVIGPSPNASSLGEYAETPVSLFTGVPQIGVPLYQVRSGSLSLPVSLSYHAQGFKVEETASDVGLGWALNAGGVITRAVHGLPDDYNGGRRVTNNDLCGDAGPSVTGGGIGYMYGYSNMDWSNPYSASCNPDLLMRSAQGIWDGEPDIFYFNFGGYTGQFVFDKNKVPHLLSQSDLLIQNTFDSNGEISGFTVTDPSGIKYYFNVTERTTAFSMIPLPGPSNAVSDPYYFFYESASEPINSVPPLAYNSSWYLNRMESATGNSSITLTYADTRQVYLSGISQSYKPGASNSNNIYTSSYQVRHVAGHQLSKIAFANGEVDFTYAQQRQDVGGRPNAVNNAISDYYSFYSISLPIDASSYALTDISVKNAAAATIKEYALSYGHFQNSSTISSNSAFNTAMACYLKRLKLTTVQELPVVSGATAKPPYQFTYDETNPLPFAFSFQQDYWGYYSGNTSAGSALPNIYYHDGDTYFNNTYTLLNGSRFSLYPWPGGGSNELQLNTIATGLSDRSPNATYLRSCILTKITFPTKGETSFDYEPNDFYYMSANRTGAGLRLKTLTDYDGVSHTKDIIKNFTYRQTASPTLSSGKVISLPQFARDQTHTSGSFDLFSNSVAQLGSTNGIVQGYTEVTTDYNGNGKSLSVFSLPATQGVETDNLVGSTYTYNRTHSQSSSTQVHDRDNYPFAPNPNYDFARGNLLEEKVYNSTGQLVKYTVNTYSLLTTDANIPALKCVFVDCNCGSGSGPGSQSADYTYAPYYIISAWYAPVQKTTKLYDPAVSSGSELSVVENYYYDNSAHKLLTRSTSTDSRGKTITSQTTYPQDYTVSGSTPEALALAGMTGARHMHSYPVEQFTWEDDGSGKKLLSAKLSTYADFFGVSGSASSPQILPYKTYSFETSTPVAQSGVTGTSFTSAGGFAKDSRYRETGSMLYDSKDNLVKYSLLNGGNYNTVSYLWGYGQQYPIAKVTNATEADIAYTGFESDDQNKWTINSGTCPLVTTGGHTGSNSLQVGASVYGPIYELTPSAVFQSKKFVLSCWVKTPGLFGSSSGSLVIYTAATTPAGSTAVYPSSAAEANKVKTFGSNGNTWTYIEVVIDLAKVKSQGGIGTTNLKLRAYVQNTDGTATMQVDDMRLYPLEARMQTYTYAPLVGATSEADEGDRPTYYEYDSYNRLMLKRDQDGYITETFDYNYKP